MNFCFRRVLGALPPPNRHARPSPPARQWRAIARPLFRVVSRQKCGHARRRSLADEDLFRHSASIKRKHLFLRFPLRSRDDSPSPPADATNLRARPGAASESAALTQQRTVPALQGQRKGRRIHRSDGDERKKKNSILKRSPHASRGDSSATCSAKRCKIFRSTRGLVAIERGVAEKTRGAASNKLHQRWPVFVKPASALSLFSRALSLFSRALLFPSPPPPRPSSSPSSAASSTSVPRPSVPNIAICLSPGASSREQRAVVKSAAALAKSHGGSPAVGNRSLK